MSKGDIITQLGTEILAQDATIERLEAEVALLRALHAGGCIQTVAEARKALDQLAEKDAEIERLNASIRRIDMFGDSVWQQLLEASDKVLRLRATVAERDATIERIRDLLGDTAGPLWAVRGVRESDIQAAFARRSL